MAADGCSVVVSIERASDEAMFIGFGCVRNYRDVRIYDTTRARAIRPSKPPSHTKPPLKLGRAFHVFSALCACNVCSSSSSRSQKAEGEVRVRRGLRINSVNYVLLRTIKRTNRIVCIYVYSHMHCTAL